MKVCVIALISLALASCAQGPSRSRALSGALDDGSETFVGEVTRYVGPTGLVTLVSSRGTTCTGSVAFSNPRDGEGALSCKDGRSGSVRLASAERGGAGAGALSGKAFKFAYGEARTSDLRNAP